MRAYLAHLSAPARRRSPETVEAELERVGAALADCADALQRLQLVQRRLELRAEYERLSSTPEVDPTEEFVAVAAAWGARKGITWPAWREAGVPADVLRRAGVTRTHKPRGE